MSRFVADSSAKRFLFFFYNAMSTQRSPLVTPTNGYRNRLISAADLRGPRAGIRRGAARVPDTHGFYSACPSVHAVLRKTRRVVRTHLSRLRQRESRVCSCFVVANRVRQPYRYRRKRKRPVRRCAFLRAAVTCDTFHGRCSGEMPYGDDCPATVLPSRNVAACKPIRARVYFVYVQTVTSLSAITTCARV